MSIYFRNSLFPLIIVQNRKEYFIITLYSRSHAEINTFIRKFSIKYLWKSFVFLWRHLYAKFSIIPSLTESTRDCYIKENFSILWEENSKCIAIVEENLLIFTNFNEEQRFNVIPSRNFFLILDSHNLYKQDIIKCSI